MLQRIQSVYLLIAVVCSGIFSSLTDLFVINGVTIGMIDSIPYLLLFEGSALLSFISRPLLALHWSSFMRRMTSILSSILAVIGVTDEPSD